MRVKLVLWAHKNVSHEKVFQWRTTRSCARLRVDGNAAACNQHNLHHTIGKQWIAG